MVFGLTRPAAQHRPHRRRRRTRSTTRCCTSSTPERSPATTPRDALFIALQLTLTGRRHRHLQRADRRGRDGRRPAPQRAAQGPLTRAGDRPHARARLVGPDLHGARELSIANESERDAAVVILADRDKVEMEDAIRARLPDLRGTRVCAARAASSTCEIWRSPDRAPRVDHRPLARRARARRERDQDDPRARASDRPPDGAVLDRRRDPGCIEPRGRGWWRRSEARLIDKAETIARIIVQTARQSGAALVYTELLDFAGEEIYFRADESLVGAPTPSALLRLRRLRGDRHPRRRPLAAQPAAGVRPAAGCSGDRRSPRTTPACTPPNALPPPWTSR